MPFRRRLRTLALVGCIAAAGVPSAALAEETGAGNVAAARKHFERARAYYGQGAYREAVNELEAAHVLDPKAKDLVFNLGVVHEKLSDIDEALTWFRLYTTMDLVPQERERADAYIRRLEGAKRELEEKLTAPQQASPGEAVPSRVQPTIQHPSPLSALQLPRPVVVLPPGPYSTAPRGRIDALTIGAAGLSAVALITGVILAVQAEREQPTSPFVTGQGQNGTYSDLVHRVDLAWYEAIGADIAFGVALVSGVTTAYLYFGRSRFAARMSTGSTTVSVGPLSGGGTFIVKGAF
jgi:tetratricopeptide (TPR) repeat protein